MIDINAQLQNIIEAAEGADAEQGFLLVTTLKRYQVQLSLLNRLEARIREEGEIVTKEYVKGRPNISVNPAITEYNKTSTAANNTAQILVRLMGNIGADLGIGVAMDEDEL